MNQIIVDLHEPVSIKSRLASLGIPYLEESLPVGDYAIGDFLIERKSLGDFLSSQAKGRLFYQIKALKESGRKPLLIIEGSIPTYSSIPTFKYLWERIQSKRIGLLMIGIPSFQVSNEEEFVHTIRLLASKLDKPPMERPRIGIWKAKSKLTKDQIKLDILRTIPKIGSIKAKLLLSKFKTIHNIIEAKPEEIIQLVGEKAWKELKTHLTE